MYLLELCFVLFRLVLLVRCWVHCIPWGMPLALLSSKKGPFNFDRSILSIFGNFGPLPSLYTVLKIDQLIFDRFDWFSVQRFLWSHIIRSITLQKEEKKGKKENKKRIPKTQPLFFISQDPKRAIAPLYISSYFISN